MECLPEDPRFPTHVELGQYAFYDIDPAESVIVNWSADSTERIF